MTKDLKIGVMWKVLFGTLTCLFFALPALSDSSKLTKTSCPGEFSKQSPLPTSLNCKMVRLPDGTMLQTVPKLFSSPTVFAGKIPGQHIICRIPDCGKNLCKNGWCEETMEGYNCTCSSGFQGKHCDEQSTEEATTKPTASPSTTMTERSDTTTSQGTTTSESVESSTADVATKTATRPMTTVSASTTSPETTASNSTELSTADATSKPTTSPTTTMSDTTTSQDTTTSKSTKEATTKPTTSPSTTMTERSDTKTSQSTTTSDWEAKTKSATSPTATMSERSDATTSQETTTSKSVESSTTDVATKTATRPMTTVSASTTSPETTASKLTELSTTDAKTKPTTSPTTTMSDITTSQETTNSTCSSPPVDCKFGGSFYNFSTAKVNHASAVSACSQYGSHLVFIESLQEQDFIVGRASGDYWIGLTGLSLSEARWLDGSSLTYTNFTQGSFHENVNCFRIYVHVVRGHGHLQYSWQDRLCSIQFRFICEKEVGI